MDKDTLLTTHEVTELVQVSRPTLYRWMGQGYFPHPVKHGTQNRWLYQEVQAWLDARKTERDTLPENTS